MASDACRPWTTLGILRILTLTTSHKPGPMVQADGPKIPPTGKSFEVDFCTVAR
jgi:hypothetical protein